MIRINQNQEEKVLREVCDDMLDEGEFIVDLGDLASNDTIVETFGITEDGRRREIGKILTNSDWAEKWSRSKYKID